MRHPLHPVLVHLPIGLWSASLLLDIASVLTGSPAYAAASFLCMGIGILGALLAAVTGLAEWADIPRDTLPHRLATTHLVLNLAVTALFIADFVIRVPSSVPGGAPFSGGLPAIVTSGQLILTCVAIVGLSVSGYVGGMLVYQFGVGYRPERRVEGHELERNDDRARAA